MKSLKQILDEHGADKSSKHKYYEIYEPLFEENRDKPINFLEIGIWMGKGMEALLEYFPKANIYGIDIFSRMKPSDVPVLSHPRAHYAIGDSTDITTTSLIQKEFGVEFDYILDDGAHWPKANMLTFRHCSPFLKDGGLSRKAKEQLGWEPTPFAEGLARTIEELRRQKRI